MVVAASDACDTDTELYHIDSTGDSDTTLGGNDDGDTDADGDSDGEDDIDDEGTCDGDADDDGDEDGDGESATEANVMFF